MQKLTEEMRREKESFVAEKQSLSDLLVRAEQMTPLDIPDVYSAFQQLLFYDFVLVSLRI